jgi:electron transfer flavoprotein beta subunit
VKILVCVKRVPITGGRMVLTADEQAIETRHLGFTISPHEECAVEEAVRLVEANGGETVVLTLGPPEAEEQLRDCMATGADRGILLKTDGSDWDAQSTAGAVVDAIRGEEPFDLILFGNESADTANYQVGIRVAHALGLPVVNGLKKIELQGEQVRCERDAGGARDVYVVPLPAALSVLEGLNLPRYPSVPGRLRAKSKPLEIVELARPEQKLEKLRLIVPPGQGKQAEILGNGPEAAPKVVELMQSLGVA